MHTHDQVRTYMQLYIHAYAHMCVYIYTVHELHTLYRSLTMWHCEQYVPPRAKLILQNKQFTSSKPSQASGCVLFECWFQVGGINRWITQWQTYCKPEKRATTGWEPHNMYIYIYTLTREKYSSNLGTYKHPASLIRNHLIRNWDSQTSKFLDRF